MNRRPWRFFCQRPSRRGRRHSGWLLPYAKVPRGKSQILHVRSDHERPDENLPQLRHARIFAVSIEDTGALCTEIPSHGTSERSPPMKGGARECRKTTRRKLSLKPAVSAISKIAKQKGCRRNSTLSRRPKEFRCGNFGERLSSNTRSISSATPQNPRAPMVFPHTGQGDSFPSATERGTARFAADRVSTLKRAPPRFQTSASEPDRPHGPRPSGA